MPPRHAISGPREPRRSAGKPSLIARLRYRLDLALSRGSLMVIGYLAVMTLAITAAAAGIVTALHLSGVNGGPKLGFAESFWQSMLRMLGKGAFATDQRLADQSAEPDRHAGRHLPGWSADRADRRVPQPAHRSAA